MAATLFLPILGGCALTTSGDNASCVSPYLDDQDVHGTYGAPPAAVSPGDALTLYGHWYANTCNDTNHAAADVEPLPPVRLTLRLPDGSTHDLGSQTPAGHDLGFSVNVRVPRSTTAGTATVSDDRTPPAIYRFTVQPG
jgi:hypothetical protein